MTLPTETSTAAPLPRTELQVERLYHLTPTDQWFYTPDGVGIVWFDERAQALNQTGAFDAPVIQVDRAPAD